MHYAVTISQEIKWMRNTQEQFVKTVLNSNQTQIGADACGMMVPDVMFTSLFF